MSVLCVDTFYEISAQLRHLVWCQLLLVYVVWATRAQCPVWTHHPRHWSPGPWQLSPERRERRENIKFVCPVTSDQMCQIETHYNKQQSAQCYHIHNYYH